MSRAAKSQPDIADLRRVFQIAARRYRLSHTAQVQAWASAMQEPEKAGRVYRAIAASLGAL